IMQAACQLFRSFKINSLPISPVEQLLTQMRRDGAGCCDVVQRTLSIDAIKKAKQCLANQDSFLGS
ncbi:hypothetical protein LZT04_00015, partial [Vibrio fluvialis]|nr:hypothetical protein [Vibrio fluvialis]